MRGFTPDPTRIVADAGILEAVRIRVRSLGSALGVGAEGAWPLSSPRSARKHAAPTLKILMARPGQDPCNLGNAGNIEVGFVRRC